MFKVNNKNSRTTSAASIWCFYCWFWTYFTAFSSASIVDFEQVNVMWDAITVMINLKHPVSGYLEFRRVKWKFWSAKPIPGKKLWSFYLSVNISKLSSHEGIYRIIDSHHSIFEFHQMSFYIITPVIFFMSSRY